MEKTCGWDQKTLAGGGRSVWLLLGWAVLLTSGPAGAADSNPLPDAGQTKCYDTNGTEIPCPAAGQPLLGQEAQYHGAAPSYSATTNTVADNNTGLVWMKSDDGTTRTWQGAVDYCNGLDYAGQTDWRLPTRFELKSIVDYGRTNPAINPAFTCQSSSYWSATTYADYPAGAWVVYFYTGYDYWYIKTNSYYVRCVRAGL